MQVLNLALSWLQLEFDEMEDRLQHTKTVLNKVHLGLLPRDRLTGLLSELAPFPECKELIEEILKLLDSKNEVTVPLSMSHPQWFSARTEMIVNVSCKDYLQCCYGGLQARSQGRCDAPPNLPKGPFLPQSRLFFLFFIFFFMRGFRFKS